MTDFKKHAKKILKSFDKEYEERKAEFSRPAGFSSSSTLRRKLKEHEKKTDQSQQSEDDILDEE
ncbi:hypothetical protein XbC2_175 [Xanthomonas phage XbC2]|nr:hypothetical protein XbC2_175 [Xanthomonas phage XbC2]